MKHLGLVTTCVLTFGILSGCSSYDAVADFLNHERAANCPIAEVLSSASVLPAFDTGVTPDSTTIVYSVRLDAVEMNCVARKNRNRSRSELTFKFHATRATGGPAATYKVPYFFATTINGRILDKEVRWQEFHFDEGQSAVDFEASAPDLITQASRRRRPTDYHFIVGFQLTKAQLDYVKQAELYTP